MQAKRRAGVRRRSARIDATDRRTASAVTFVRKAATFAALGVQSRLLPSRAATVMCMPLGGVLLSDTFRKCGTSKRVKQAFLEVPSAVSFPAGMRSCGEF